MLSDIKLIRYIKSTCYIKNNRQTIGIVTMHKVVESNIVVTLACGCGVNASAKTTVVAATGIAHAMTSVLNRFASLMPHKVSMHQVSAGATKSLKPQTK